MLADVGVRLARASLANRVLDALLEVVVGRVLEEKLALRRVVRVAVLVDPRRHGREQHVAFHVQQRALRDDRAEEMRVKRRHRAGE